MKSKTGNKKKNIPRMNYAPHFFCNAPLVSKLKSVVNTVTGLRTNSGNVEFYSNGKSTIPEHSDFEPLFR